VFVYSLHRELHGQIYSTDKLPDGSRISSLGSSKSLAREIIDQFQGQTTLVESVQMVPAAHKCINGFFFALSSANIKTGSETNIRDSHFGL
jgi:hypothetical protein